MPEPSLDGHRRYGVLAARAVGGLTLLLTVTSALEARPLALLLDAAGPARAGAATVRRPARGLRAMQEARA